MVGCFSVLIGSYCGGCSNYTIHRCAYTRYGFKRALDNNFSAAFEVFNKRLLLSIKAIPGDNLYLLRVSFQKLQKQKKKK